MEQIQVRKAELNQRLIAAESEAVEYDEFIQKYENELKEVSSTIINYSDETKKLETEIGKLQVTIDEKSEQFRACQAAFHREESRLESLKNMTERYDGYGNSIRKVMEKKEEEKGIHGVVADIIKVDKAYEVAIETALGGNIQNIVTEDEDTAKSMIQYLKQNKLGRATFLPLTGISAQEGKREKEALDEKGVVGIASSLVNVEEKYKVVAEHLLGRILVVKHIDDGIRLARKYKQSIKMVTLEGEFINAGGSMTGGAFKNSSNLLSRRREVEELEIKVVRLKKEIDEISRLIDECKEARTGYYAKIEEIKAELQKAYVVQNTAKMNMDQMIAKKTQAKDSVKQIHQEGAELEAQIQEIKDNHESIQVELEISEQLEKELNLNSNVNQKELEEMRELEGKQMQETEKVHLSYASFEQKLQFMVENENRILEEIHKFKEELSALDASKGDASEEIKTKEDEIANIHQTIADSKELFVEIEAEIQKYVAEKEELSKKHKEFLAKREELSKHMAELDKEAFRLNSRREGYEEASEKHINYMWEEYELTYSSAMEIRDENLTDLAFMKKEIQRLKNEIKALGSVNVNAIEDYKNVSERYEFLKTQHDDLIEAESTLIKIIEELDAAMRKQFKESFEQINIEFDKVFRQLFGGGKGTLELIEDEDILEAGIRVIAQPPGKKLQNMMQLSGGEKALTAISLLFAIQNLKPSPFCLLDEIEAALDDSNVDRFAKYLHKLTKHTQFIVITHRKGTMTAADRLYGITMQEKGVSALVSVDLLEHELDK
jgi:chromosome segregation protein